MTEPNWWEDLYDNTVADLFMARREPDELEATLAFLTQHLRLGAGHRVFDQCCGIGSLSLPLAARGIEIVGTDACAAYICRAADAANRTQLPARYFVADAFEFVPDVPCDAAFNWWTSFGYAAEDSRNVQMLCRACDALKPGGMFALDFLNAAQVLSQFHPALVRRAETPEGEVILLRESTVNLRSGTLDQVWTFQWPDGRRRTGESHVRLYLPDTVGSLLRQAGLADIEFFGGVRNEPLTTFSPRCICVARKP